MDNKKTAVIVSVFAVVLLLLIGIMGVLGKLPFLGKPIAFIISLVIMLFVVGFFAVIVKRRK